MSRLNKKDLELLHTGQSIDLSEPKYAYLGGNFTQNPNDYVEVLVCDTNDNFLESAVVDSTDYTFDLAVGIKLKTGTILRKLGYDRGRYIVKYNFLRKIAGSYENILVDENNTRYTGEFDPNNNTDIARIGKDLFIKEYKYFTHEISPSRQEIRLVSDSIKEPENNQKYLRDFYNMQRITKKIKSDNSDDGAVKFVTDPTVTKHAESYEIELVNTDNFFTPEMVGGRLIINKAFVLDIITDNPNTSGWGAGAIALEEVQSTALVARFAVTNVDQADVRTVGDKTLSVLYDKLKGLTLDSVPPRSGAGAAWWSAVIQNFGYNDEDIEDLRNMEVGAVGGWLFAGGGGSKIEISSISQRNLESPATYTWQIFGWDFDGRPDGKRDKTKNKKNNYRPIRIKTANNDGDISLFGGGLEGVEQDGLTWTAENVGKDGSKIAIELHSNNVHVGVRLHITNDVGQEDEIVIPVFLETQD